MWKGHHIWYCIWGNAWFVSMEKTSILIKFLRMNFMNLLHYLQILKMLYLSLYYLGNSRKIFMIRNSLEDLVNIVAIWLFKYFMKLLRSEQCTSNTLTCELLMWFCHCAMISVITLFVWRPCHVALGEVFGFEIVLDILCLTMNNM